MALVINDVNHWSVNTWIFFIVSFSHLILVITSCACACVCVSERPFPALVIVPVYFVSVTVVTELKTKVDPEHMRHTGCTGSQGWTDEQTIDGDISIIKPQFGNKWIFPCQLQKLWPDKTNKANYWSPPNTEAVVFLIIISQTCGNTDVHCLVSPYGSRQQPVHTKQMPYQRYDGIITLQYN